MRIVLQRVTRASVTVDEAITGAIQTGFLALVGVGQEDDESDVDYLIEKTYGLRVFVDENGKMNKALADVEGDVLAVSQFTLYGDCRKGRRPSFVAAMEPQRANVLFERYVTGLRAKGLSVPTGVFGAHMDVELLNDGPVTLLLCSKKSFWKDLQPKAYFSLAFYAETWKITKHSFSLQKGIKICNQYDFWKVQTFII